MDIVSPHFEVVLTNAAMAFLRHLRKTLVLSPAWKTLHAASTWPARSNSSPKYLSIATQSFHKPESGEAGLWSVPGRRSGPILRRITRLATNMPRIPKWARRKVQCRRKVASRQLDAFEHVPVAIICVTQRGEIVFANSRATKLFGYGSDALRNAPVSLLFPALTAKDALAETGRLAPRHLWPASMEQTVIARRKDGVEFPAEVTTSECRIDDVQIGLAAIVDRSERFELYRNRQELAHLTRVSALGELAGSLAHELSQPLTAILSNAQAAQRFLDGDPVNVREIGETLKDIVLDDCRAGEIIRRIRALVRKGDVELQRLDVGGVIRDVALLVHSDAIVRGIRVTVAIADDLPAVLADRVQLQQVILNLLLNGFDAVGDCVAADRVVAIEVLKEPRESVHITVRDRGPGLTVEQLDRIFKPFFTSKPHGLGLGLSISRTIVAAHGGRLWAENNADRGASFHVALPASIPAAADSGGRQP
jgi:two-component system, LuxR family, sensor kinase FixL